MSAPSGTGGASGLGAVLGGAGGMLATASARHFMQGLPFVESTRLDWDFQKFFSSNAIFAVNSIVDSVVLGRGTWHVQVSCAYASGVAPDQAILTLNTGAGGTGFYYDLAVPGAGNGVDLLEAVIALDAGETLFVMNRVIGLPGGTQVILLWNAKRMTR